MRPLSASALLEVWERGASRTPVEQALVILETAFPQAGRDALVRLTIPERDACLLSLHELAFGAQLNGLAACPACGERVELSFDSRLLCPPGTLLPDLVTPEPHNPETTFRLDNCRVIFRLPTSSDLLDAASSGDALQARAKLLTACVLSAKRGVKSLPVGELPAGVQEALIERMGQAASLADPNLAVTCPACGQTWTVLFDIVSYFWSEIGAWARRLLNEVHLLASAYGWREADILSMTAMRRQAYLELIGS
jgi:hypothetical protein